ncbi:hypothetical protein [Roseibium sp.]|uniref:hypothetical protein n=1 Tax=Roseibium sp. TaxID=1936156 RepID=UPI003A97F985
MLDTPQFSLSDNSEAIGTIDLRDIRQFLSSLQKGTMLGLSVTLLIGKPVNVTFDVSGIGYVDKLFGAVCKW